MRFSRYCERRHACECMRASVRACVCQGVFCMQSWPAGCRFDMPLATSLINICKTVNEWLGPEHGQARQPHSLPVVCPAACPSDCIGCSMAQPKADGSRMPGSDPVADGEHHSRSAFLFGHLYKSLGTCLHIHLHTCLHTYLSTHAYSTDVYVHVHGIRMVDMSTRMLSVRRATSSATRSSQTLLSPGSHWQLLSGPVFTMSAPYRSCLCHIHTCLAVV